MTDTVPSRVLLLLPDEDVSVVSAGSPLRLASLYYELKDAGLEIVLASRSGGFSAVVGDMRRLLDNAVVARLMADAFARDELSESIPLGRVYTEDFDTLILFAEGAELAHPEIAQAISEFLDGGKAVIASETINPAEGVVPRIHAMLSKAR
ncbi:hypothetical protein LJR030_004986 [Rhizobium sp. LjRoot30]|uniref:hypothetical protein n=1 Tax=Rhizobium sp. LjRoot30 TaxID=3342320 RepID=UPI003ECE0D3F